MDTDPEKLRAGFIPGGFATDVALRTHTADPIPYMLYDSTKTVSCAPAYTEEAAVKTGYEYPEGYRLMEHFTKEA